MDNQKFWEHNLMEEKREANDSADFEKLDTLGYETVADSEVARVMGRQALSMAEAVEEAEKINAEAEKDGDVARQLGRVAMLREMMRGNTEVGK